MTTSPKRAFGRRRRFSRPSPTCVGIISPTTVGVAAAAQALETNAAADRVALTGLGLPNQMRSYVKNGTVTAFQLWDPAEMGYAAVYLIDAIRDGFSRRLVRRMRPENSAHGRSGRRTSSSPARSPRSRRRTSTSTTSKGDQKESRPVLQVRLSRYPPS